MYFGGNKFKVIEQGMNAFNISNNNKIHTIDRMIEIITSKIPEQYDKNFYLKMKKFLKYVETQRQE